MIKMTKEIPQWCPIKTSNMVTRTSTQFAIQGGGLCYNIEKNRQTLTYPI